MSRVFVYGTLRAGEFNHSRFGFSKRTKFIGPATIKGFQMYFDGSIPFLYKTDNPEHVVIGEVYEYTDTPVYNKLRKFIKDLPEEERDLLKNEYGELPRFSSTEDHIDAMESSYKKIKIDVLGEKTSVYAATGQPRKGLTLITSGDFKNKPVRIDCPTCHGDGRITQ